MNAFDDDANGWQRLDFQLLYVSPIVLYHQWECLNRDLTWFESEGYKVLSLPNGNWNSSDELLDALAQALSFPTYFGRNLDAFDDCLSEVDVPQGSGLLIVLPEFQIIAASFRREAQIILDIFADNSRRFLLTGRRFLVFVQSSDPAIAFEPIGATPVMWNPQERANSKRGL